QPGGANENRQQSDDEGQSSYRDGHSGSEGGGNANCSNVVAATDDQCKSTNVAIQANAALINNGNQSNNANQNNQPGGANENRQQSDDESFEKGGHQGYDGKKNEDGRSHGDGGGGNANCSNLIAATSDQCQSRNIAIQKNF